MTPRFTTKDTKLTKLARRVFSVIAAALVAVSLASGFSGMVFAQSQTPFSIGLVRHDGFLQPVAAWRDGKWRPLVTEGLRLSAEAKALSTSGWTLMTKAVAAPRPLMARLTTTKSHCEEVEGFATDSPQLSLEVDVWPRPKVGVAIHGMARVERIEDVTALPDSGSRNAADAIVLRVAQIESESVAQKSALAKTTADLRARRAFRFVELARAEGPRGAQYYFEIEKEYPEIQRDLVVTGWLRLGSSAPQFAGVQSWIADESRMPVATSDPHAVIHLPSGVVWLVEDQGYETESYALVDPEASDVRLVSVPAGGC